MAVGKEAPDITFTHVQEFYSYLDLQGYSKGHYTHLDSYFRKHLKGKTFLSPQDLQRYIKEKVSGIASLATTVRVYLNFLEKYGHADKALVEQYRSFVKFKESNPDIYVPSDDEVIGAYRQVQDHDSLEIVFLVLATSGIRYVECLDFLRTYDVSRFRQHEGFVSYPLLNNRSTKTCNDIFMPDFVFSKLRRVENTYQSHRVRLKKKGVRVSFKYLRKWHYNLMLYNNVPESVADWIQGRSNRGISANHYLAKAQQAEFWYEKFLGKVYDFFHTYD